MFNDPYWVAEDLINFSGDAKLGRFPDATDQYEDNPVYRLYDLGFKRENGYTLWGSNDIDSADLRQG